MKTLAPELSALMTILASAGPVSSTRRSSRSAGRGRNAPLRLAQLPGLLRERRALSRREALLALGASLQKRPAPSAEAPLEIADQAQRFIVEQLVLAGDRLRWRRRPSRGSPLARRRGERAQCGASSAQERGSVRRQDPLARLLRQAPERTAQADAAVPGALGGSRAVPARRADPQPVAPARPRSHRRRSRRRRPRGRGTGGVHRPSLRSGRRVRSHRRRRARRHRVHRSARSPRRLRAGASAPSSARRPGAAAARRRGRALARGARRRPGRRGPRDRRARPRPATRSRRCRPPRSSPSSVWPRAPTRGGARSSARGPARSPARQGLSRTAANRPSAQVSSAR